MSDQNKTFFPLIRQIRLWPQTPNSQLLEDTGTPRLRLKRHYSTLPCAAIWHFCVSAFRGSVKAQPDMCLAETCPKTDPIISLYWNKYNWCVLQTWHTMIRVSLGMITYCLHDILYLQKQRSALITPCFHNKVWDFKHVFPMLACRMKRYPISALLRDCITWGTCHIVLVYLTSYGLISYFWQQRARVNWG